MSNLYVCKEYETPYEEGMQIVETIEEHDAKVRTDTIDEILETAYENEEGFLVIRKCFVEQLKEKE